MKVKSETHNYLVIVLSFIFPFILMLIYCMIRGISFADLYIPASFNNDCVFYYQMVNGTVSFGHPLGYFGYNESHALIGGYGVWGPLIIVPWSLWGKVFGWNYISGIVCNIVIISIGFSLFSYLSKFDAKKIFSVFLCLILFPSFHINVLSLLPEVFYLFFLLVFFGLVIRIKDLGIKKSYITTLYLICFVLTLVRPYFVFLYLFPIYLIISSKNKRRVIFVFISIAIACFSFCGYLIISKWFAAEYFSSSFNYQVLEFLKNGDIKNVFGYSFFAIRVLIDSVFSFIKGAFEYGLTIGINFFTILFSNIILFAMCLIDRKLRYKSIYYLYILNCILLFFTEALFAQHANEAGRHFWCYSIIGIILIFSLDWDLKHWLVKVIAISFFGFFCVKGAYKPTDYDVPIIDNVIVNNVEFWQEAFENEIIISDGIGYDNTVIWVIGDYIDDHLYLTEYNELYALPAGVGISCCYPDYVINSFDSIKSRYIISIPNGNVSKLCDENNLILLAQNEYVVLYKKY